MPTPDSLTARFGSAKRPERDVAHRRPAGTTDDEVEALGKFGEALETVEQARGALYEFHRLSGHADLTLQDAVRQLRGCGHDELADDLSTALVGRDVVDGRWTFQLVEEYDAGYWSVFRAAEQHARAAVGDVEPHTFEAEMKQQEQSG